MTTHQRILLGGLGALTPVILNLLAVDLTKLIVQFTWVAVIGYLIRIILLFYLGGVIAFLHKKEKEAIKIFELGIAAPALITVMINANQIEIPKVAAHPESRETALIQWIQPAYAQSDVRQFSLPKESPIQQLWRGLSGTTSDRVWFVIAGQYPEYEKAAARRNHIREKHPDYSVSVYSAFQSEDSYSVVIGEHLTQKEAESLRAQAVRDSMTGRVDVWTFPKQKGTGWVKK